MGEARWFVGWARFCAHADFSESKPTPSGVARQLVTFFCFAKKKVTKEKATPVCRRCAVPCVARLVRRLRNSRYALKQSSPKSPDQPPLLGGAQGRESQNLKAQRGHIVPTLLLHLRTSSNAIEVDNQFVLRIIIRPGKLENSIAYPLWLSRKTK